MTIRSRGRAIAAVAALAALTLACGDDGDPGGTTPAAISQVVVDPPAPTLNSLGGTLQLTAEARDASGARVSVPAADFSWSSSAPGIVSVDASGRVEALASGTATISASPAGSSVSGSSAVTVDQSAASIVVTLDRDSIVSGSNAQATAAVTDAGGSPLTTSSPTWSSSAPLVATVDGSGRITGVSDGTAIIAASEDGVIQGADLVVVRRDLVVGRDTLWSGDVVAGDVTVPAGITVTLAGDTRVDVAGTLTLAGTIAGDCTALRIEGEAVAVVSGTLTNVCVAQARGGVDAPGVVLDLPGGIDLTDGTVVSSGPITLQSAPGATPVLGREPQSGATSSAAQSAFAGIIDLTRSELRTDPSTAPSQDDPADPRADGSPATIIANARVRLDRTTIQAQAGGAGAIVSQTASTDIVVAGGPGGAGGSVHIVIPPTGVLDIATTQGPSSLIAGDGGPGGPASGTAEENGSLPRAPGVEAFGGRGGEGGSVRIEAPALLDGPLDGLTTQVGFGARGGNATAVASRGVDATSAQDAQPGGDANAEAGEGGDAGGLSGGYQGQPLPPGRTGGPGGVARATAGDGGDGIRERPAGAAGGTATARAGTSGDSWQTPGVVGADALADGGNGGAGADVCAASNDTGIFGQVAVVSDPAGSDAFILDAGTGSGISLLLKVFFGDAGPGGPGGDGGSLGARGGRGGFGQNVEAPEGVGGVGLGGNGGAGGDGSPPGSGGEPGASVVGLDGAPIGQPTFTRGAGGAACGSSLRLRPLAQTGSAQQIAITGSDPWVDVTGTLGEDGVITATGRGTVAGVDDVLVEFSGTWDAAARTLVGTYTVDSERVIDPGHPTVYSVNVQGN